MDIKEIKQAVAEIDRLGDEGQKAMAMHLAGITRRKVYGVIAEGLTAFKDRWGVDEQGNDVVMGDEPDYARRERCALLAVKLFGDLVEKRESVSEVTIRQEERDEIARLIRMGVSNGN